PEQSGLLFCTKPISVETLFVDVSAISDGNQKQFFSSVVANADPAFSDIFFPGFNLSPERVGQLETILEKVFQPFAKLLLLRRRQFAHILFYLFKGFSRVHSTMHYYLVYVVIQIHQYDDK